jgi:hypothetical protein
VNHDVLSRKGYIVQLAADWQLELDEFEPVLSYEFTYASGDDNASDKDQDAWGGFYEAQDFGTIHNTLFDLSNIMIHTVALEAGLIEDLTAKLSYHGLWRAEDVKAASGSNPNNQTVSLIQPDGAGTVVTALAKNGEDELGHELDLDLTYAYTEDVTIGASMGVYWPGDVFLGFNDSAAKQAIVSLGVAF